MSACSGAGGERASTATSTTAAPATGPSSSQPATTAAAASTTLASRTTTTPATSSPEAYARTLFDAWAAGDRAAAAAVAQPEAVTALFARQWQASDGWVFAECAGAAGSVICTWRRPAGQQLLLRVQGAAGGGPVAVSEIRFQP